MIEDFVVSFAEAQRLLEIFQVDVLSSLCCLRCFCLLSYQSGFVLSVLSDLGLLLHVNRREFMQVLLYLGGLNVLQLWLLDDFGRASDNELSDHYLVLTILFGLFGEFLS